MLNNISAIGSVLGADAWVISSNAPAAVIGLARLAKVIVGERIQICDGTDDLADVRAAILSIKATGGLVKGIGGQIEATAAMTLDVVVDAITGETFEIDFTSIPVNHSFNGIAMTLAKNMYSEGAAPFNGKALFILRNLSSTGNNGVNARILKLDRMQKCRMTGLTKLRGYSVCEAILLSASAADCCEYNSFEHIYASGCIKVIATDTGAGGFANTRVENLDYDCDIDNSYGIYVPGGMARSHFGNIRCGGIGDITHSVVYFNGSVSGTTIDSITLDSLSGSKVNKKVVSLGASASGHLLINNHQCTAGVTALDNPTGGTMVTLAGEKDWLSQILPSGHWKEVPVNAGWSTAGGSDGVVTQTPFVLKTNVVGTVGGTAIAYTPVALIGQMSTLNMEVTPFNNILAVEFLCYAQPNDANAVRYWQLGPGTSHGNLSGQGWGIKVANLTVTAQSYGSTLGEAAFADAMVTSKANRITILHDTERGVVEWFMNGKRQASQGTAACIPSGASTAQSKLLQSLGTTSTSNDCRWETSAVRIFSKNF